MSVNSTTTLHKQRPVCPSCKHFFILSDSGVFDKRAKCPMILPCGHTVCTTCLRMISCNKRLLSCPICKKPTDLSDENAYKSLPLNYHMMGSIFANSSIDIETRFNVKFKRYNPRCNQPVTGKPAAAFSTKMDICKECTENETDVICIDCNLTFCQECYTKSHSESESKLGHRPWPIVSFSKKQSHELCAEHKAEKMYFCNTDNMLVCPHCTATGTHNGHNVEPICEKNKTFEDEVKTFVGTARKVSRCLKHSEKTLKKLASAIEVRIDLTGIEIHKEFSNLHAILELREHELIKNVQQEIKKKTQFINQVIQTMESNRQRLKMLISDSEERLSSNSEILNPEWLKKVIEIQEIPCYVEIPDVEMSQKVHSIMAKPDLDTTFLSKHSFLGQLPSDSLESIFEVKKVQDVEADTIEISSDDEETDMGEVDDEYLSMPELESISIKSLDVDDTVQEDTTSECSKTTVSESRSKPRKDPLQSATFLRLKPINWTPLKTDIVEVVYVVDPSHFYILRNVDRMTSVELHKCIKTWCHKENKENTTLDSINTGDLCLAYSKGYKSYYRARILEYPSHTKGGTTEEQPKVNVFFIDYGNTEVVRKDRLRRIPDEFTSIPGMAVKCSLGQIDPVDEQMGWKREATKLFTRFTKNIMVLMTVYEFTCDTLYVDIGACKMPCKTPCSVREALIFMGLACFTRKPHVPDDTCKVLPTVPSKLEKYSVPQLPSKGTVTPVLVSHVNTPGDFYIQLSQYAGELATIMAETKSRYREKKFGANEMDMLLWGPCKGMACAARFSRDGMWYRAEVLKVMDDRQIEVLYVDFGNTEVVDYTQVKQLFPRLLKWPKMAVKCSLHQVQPCLTESDENDSDGKAARDWSEDAKRFFEEEAAEKVMRAMFEGVLNEAVLVSLYTKSEPKTCLNAEIIARHYAEECKENFIDKVVTKTEEKEEQVTLSVPTATATTAAAQSEETGAESSDLTMIVSFSHIVSPDEMYAQLVDHIPDLESMTRTLQDVYMNTEPEDSLWNCDDLCMVFNAEKRSWCRGQINSLCGDDAAEVFLIDYGNTLTVKLDQLRIILEQFLQEKFAFRCHLTGIVAPGGGKWPFVAIECLRELAAKFKPVYMKRVTKLSDKGMAVTAFGKEIKMPGPLEPIRETSVIFTEELIDRGLALPMRRSRNAVVITEDSDAEEQHLAATNQGIFGLGFETLNSSKSEESLLSLNSTETAALQQHERNAAERRWKPPQPGLKVGQRFTAVPTHVTHAGEICLHDKEKNGPTLEYISVSLKTRYTGTQPQSHDLYWYKDQMCVAQFEMDGLWYRANVIKVVKGQVQVHFIDYGNEETVNPGQLRKEVVTDTVPQQGFCCELYGIVPASEDGVWTKAALDYLHLLICEKPCEAVVMALPKGQNPKISLSVIAEEKVENTMVEMGFAVRVEVEDDDEDVDEEELDAYVIEESNEEPQLSFKDLDPIAVGESFHVIVSEIVGPNKFFVQRQKNEEAEPSDYQAEIDRHCDELLRYSDRMNAEAEEWPSVANARVRSACCAQYLDGSWFRAIIIDREPGGSRAAVFYVDYGNAEELDTDRLRVLPEDLFELPKQAVECQLHQVAPVDEWNEEIAEHFKSIYVNEELHAVVKSCGPPVQLDLLVHNTDSDKMELAYQHLIDANLIKMVIDKKESL